MFIAFSYTTNPQPTTYLIQQAPVVQTVQATVNQNPPNSQPSYAPPPRKRGRKPKPLEDLDIIEIPESEIRPSDRAVNLNGPPNPNHGTSNLPNVHPPSMGASTGHRVMPKPQRASGNMPQSMVPREASKDANQPAVHPRASLPLEGPSGLSGSAQNQPPLAPVSSAEPEVLKKPGARLQEAPSQSPPVVSSTTSETPPQQSFGTPETASTNSSEASQAKTQVPARSLSPRASPASSASSSAPTPPLRPIIHVRKRIPIKFTPENSDRIEVIDLGMAKEFDNISWIPKTNPLIPNWNHFRAKHVCRLSIATTDECGKVVNGKVRELTVHVDYDVKKHKDPVILCLYYYMRSHLLNSTSPKTIKYEKMLPAKLRKFHVRFIIPPSSPFGEFFYVTGHIGTSKEYHDFGALPGESLALPIDVKTK
ncbi:hypothetical protein L596_006864 [Steinernema carpocapsae]|uniref:Uncharacterized protein n=1 Tax=Steinernema carpocapsae TaxID=34508 RepID=A0A4U5P8G2_STECR|nr:hypothetical protein L596_006864 [Steinernema carpocapsae]